MFTVSGINSTSLGKIAPELMMKTKVGLVRKVNKSTCYVGDNEDPTSNPVFSKGELSVPIWLLTDEQVQKIEYFGDHSLESLSSSDRAMMLLAKEDCYTALEVIRNLSDFHIQEAVSANKKAKKDESADQERLFDTFNDLNAYGKLVAVNKLAD